VIPVSVLYALFYALVLSSLVRPVPYVRCETKRDDDARTGRLLDHLDAMDQLTERPADPDAPLSKFEEVVLFGVAYDPGQPYPPAGHTYPKRGA
jgi:hypothetical protein